MFSIFILTLAISVIIISSIPNSVADNITTTDTTISVEGTDFIVSYTITGGKVLSIMPDTDAYSLIIRIETTSDGQLSITLPRELIDAVHPDGEDDSFVVFIDGEEISYDGDRYYDGTATDTERTITIKFYADSEEIEIIGKFVETSTSYLEPITPSQKIPDWIKNNAKWWSEGQIEDSDFVKGVQYMIKEKIMLIPDLPKSSSSSEQKIPEWIKNNAGWWAQGLISQDDFVSGIKYLVEKGIILVN